MDAVTAVSGSGPAYFALLAEAMIEAGILLGLSREISTQLVVQTMLGTGVLLRDEKMHPVELREAVTSPGGTTIRAIHELEQAGVRAAFLNAIQAAMERSRELAAGDGLAAAGAPSPSATASSRSRRQRLEHDDRVGDGDVLEVLRLASRRTRAPSALAGHRRRLAYCDRRERVGDVRGKFVAARGSRRRATRASSSRAEHEQRQRGRVAADRRLGPAAPASSAQRASSAAAAQSPASSRALIAPIGRPQLPGGASAKLSR